MAKPDTRTRRLRAAVAAVAIHVGAAGLAWMLPDRPPAPAPPPEWARTEVVLLDGSMFEPAADVTALPQAPAETQPPTAEAEAEAAGRDRPAADRTPRARPNRDPALPSAPAVVPSAPSAGSGLALSGLRGSSRTRPAVGAPRPTVVVPTRPPPRTSPAPAGPSLPRASSASKDRAPRSLAEAGFKRRKDGSYRYRERGSPFKATIHPNGRIEFSLKGTSAHRLGMSDAMRAAGGEELFAAAKKRLLAETLELRMALAQSWAREQMRAQLQDLQRQLLSTWTRTEWSAPKRREELFTLWDDCEESLSVDLTAVDAKLASSIDTARAQAGTRARKKIVAFINQHLPHDSTHAYTSAELRTLNATRRSKKRFKPYAKTAKAGATVPPAPEPPATPPGAG